MYLLINQKIHNIKYFQNAYPQNIYNIIKIMHIKI